MRQCTPTNSIPSITTTVDYDTVEFVQQPLGAKHTATWNRVGPQAVL